MTAGPVLAIDLGGTKILAALVDGANVIACRQVKTPRADANAWMDAIAGLVADWHGRFRHAGIAVTGGIRDGRWFALNPATLPVPAGFPLVAVLTSRLSVPVLARNDAQAAAWGEYRQGAGQGADMVFLTISTGIGGGIVFHGKLLTGRQGLAGHIGIGPIETPDGERLLEEVGSGAALARLAQNNGHDADPPAIMAAVNAGEDWAINLLDMVVAPVVQRLRTLQLALDPDLFVIGGGLGLAPGYLDRLSRHLADCRPEFRPDLRAAALGTHAGLIGIADLASTTSASEAHR